MRILVTGAKGFVGRNLCAQLNNIRDGKARNYGFASTLLDTLKKHGNTCPVMLSSSQQASLTGRFGNSEYGRSKKAGEDLFLKYGEDTGAKVLVYRFPNLFGKWCRPNYNSAVSTFCNAVANDLPYTVNDPSVELELLYIDDLVDEMIACLKGEEHRCEFDGLGVFPIKDGRYCYVPTTHKATLGEIVDVRNKSTLKYAMKGVDYVFHAAALKQVPSCEFFPMEAVKTNVIGTDNVLDAAIEAGVKCVICLSTDKAAYPINAMGISKALEEKVAIAKSRYSGDTKICCTRYGNVMCSRGSVIPLWIEQIRNGNPITLTEPSMTRFIMSLDEAVDLVLFAFENGSNGDILVQKAPACTIQTQAEAVCELFGGKKKDIKVIGIRHGEKMYETLLTKEEAAKAVDMGDFYRVPADNRDLNYDKFFKEGDTKRALIDEFNSNNTRRLNIEETRAKIASLEYIQNELNGIPNVAK